MGKAEQNLEHADARGRGLLDIGQAGRSSGVSVKMVAAGHMEDLKKKIAEMQSMVSTLQHLTHNCHGDSRPDCPILADLASSGREGS